jgi:WD40 repeat protein/tetratricopeptide (TPR) repeat protein
MRKEKSRRYQSALELANDIENYLKGAALLAGPESATYRVTKLGQRHWRALVAGLVIAATLVAGTTISSLMYLRSEKSRSGEAAQRKVAEAERDRATAAEQEAKRRLVDLYEQRGRECFHAKQFDEALVLLTEAYHLDGQRRSLRFLLTACARQHDDPAMSAIAANVPWDFGYDPPQKLPFATSPAREYVAFLDQTRDLITIFDTGTGDRALQLPGEKATALAFTPDGRHFVVRSEKDALKHALAVYALESTQPVTVIERRNTNVDEVFCAFEEMLPSREQLDGVYRSIVMDRKGKWFAFVDTPEVDGIVHFEVKLWDFDAQALHTAERVDSPLVMFGPRTHPAYDHWQLNALNLQRRYWIWEVPTLDRSGGFYWYSDYGRFAPPGSYRFYSVDQSGMVLFHRQGNTPIARFPDVTKADFSPDGKILITRGKNGSSGTVAPVGPRFVASLWRTAAGDHIGDVAGAEVLNWHFTPDSAFVVAEHKDGRITIWRTGDGQLHLTTPAGESQRFTDISSDGAWMVTCSAGEPRTVQLWNLGTKEVYTPFCECAACTDLTGGFVQPDVDRIFAHSMVRPSYMARFNRDDTALITRAGLQSLTRVMLPPDEVVCLVRAHVPLRLTAGRMRQATETEMLLARHLHLQRSKGAQDPATIHATLQAATHMIETGDLSKAQELTRAACTTIRSMGSPLPSEVRQVKRRLHAAFYVKGDLNARRRQYEAAVLCYESALRLMPEDPCTLNALAWLQAASGEPRVQDSVSALAHAQEACQLTNWNHWKYLSTYAVACAVAGQFSEAITQQHEANELLPTCERPRWQANFAQRLRLFNSHRAYDEKVFRNLPTENLLGWWTCDDGQGRVVHDLSGNRNDCFFLGHPKWRPGKMGSALQFGLGDFALCARAGTFNIHEALTVAAWLRIGDVPETDELKNVFLSHGRGGWSIGYKPSTHKLSFVCTDLRKSGEFNQRVSLETEGTVDEGQWHHIAGVYDGTAMRLYLNGSLDSEIHATGAIRQEVSLRLGAGHVSPFFGLLDDVRLYNAALDADAVADLHRTGNGRGPSGLLVRARDLHPNICAGDTVKLDAAVFQYGDTVLSQAPEVQWTVSQSLAAVELKPAATALDCSAVFTASGLYELLLTAKVGTMESYDTIAAIVYPREHDGLIAHYAFTGGDTEDYTGYGRPGHLNGGARIVVDPNRGSVLSLDGDEDYLDLGSGARYQLLDAITVAVWMKNDSFDRPWEAIITKGDSSWALQRYGMSETVQFLCFGPTRDDEYRSSAVGKTRVADNRWHHLVGTYDGREVCLYTDGIQESVTEGPTRLFVNRASVAVGANLEAPNREWKGLIDDVRLYNRALRTEEVACLYEKTK